MSAGAEGVTPLAARLLPGLLLWHAIAWVAIPVLCYRMLPLDTLELLGWGMQWQLGYYKHPPLGAWLGEAMLVLSGGRLDSLYLLAQLCVIVTFLYVWRSARLLLDPTRAILATVLLEGSYFHVYLTPNFNMNSLQLPLWAGLAYHFLRALRGAQHHWLLWGVFVALCLLAKYSGLLLLAACAIVLFADPRGRGALRRPGPWLGAVLAGLLLLPHAIWLSAHGELPLAYLRGFDPPSTTFWSGHVLEPLRFAVAALLGLLFAGLLFLGVRDSSRPRARLTPDAWVVIALCLLPLLLTMGYGAFSGSRLKSTWAFPFFNLAGIVLFLLLPTAIDRRRIHRFTAALIAVAVLSATVHVLYKVRSDRSKTAFDGRELALAIEQKWTQEYQAPLRIVVADHVLSAIVSSYAPSRPSMLVNADFSISLWLGPAQLQRQGAAVLCAADTPCFESLAARATPPRRLRVSGRDFVYFFLPPAPVSSALGARIAPAQTGAAAIAYP